MRRLLTSVSILLALTIAALIIKPNLYLYLSRQKNINPQSLTGEYNSHASNAIFNNQAIDIPQPTSVAATSPTVLGQTTANKRIDIDLNHQKLYAYENDQLVYEFPVSSGKWARTPTGIFNIWVKLRYSKMEGGSKAINTYYYLPNVPYIMYFSNDQIPRHRGFGLHGTYWHNNFGHPMSHGCINMKTEDAAKLFYWTQPDLQGQRSIWASADNPGTSIHIFGTAPWE